jgi:uncharacterized membrane protein YdjX (TVP38/TMEM64 family)
MRRKLLLLIPVVGLTFVALAAKLGWFGQTFTWAEMVTHDTAARMYIENHPIGSVLIGLSLYVLASLIPGTTGKALIAGWLFGAWLGTVIVNVGLTVAAMIIFFVSRYLLRDLVQLKFQHQLAWLNKAIARDGATYLFTLRILHCPYSVTNYVFGPTAMKARSFWWASQLGMLPGNIVFAYAGSQVPSLRRLTEHGVAEILSWKLAGALVLLSLFPLAIRYVSRFKRQQPTQEEDADASRL